MSSNVLVTGGAGFIGAHACKALAKAGYVPVTYDNLVCGHADSVKWGPLELGDILDRARLDFVLERYRPTAVLHFAGFAYVGESVKDPSKYYMNNVVGSLTLLDSMRGCRVDKIVFSSSCATYGMPRNIPITESHPQDPVNPYGTGKLVVERMLREFNIAHGLRFVSLRYFNAAGADPDGELGELHEPETHLIPLVLFAALADTEVVSIFGTDYPTFDGTCIRDYVHVSDLAEAHVSALKYLERGEPSINVNLGTGRGVSVREVIATCRRVTGRQLGIREAPRRPGDPPELVADASLARHLLDWTPTYLELDDAVRHAWNWLSAMHERRSAHISTVDGSTSLGMAARLAPLK